MNVIMGATDGERDATRRFYTSAEKCVELASPFFLNAFAVAGGMKDEVNGKAEMCLSHGFCITPAA